MKLYLDPREAAALAGVSRALVYQAISRGEIRHIRIPPGRRSIRIEPNAISEWLSKFEQPPRA